MSSVLPAFNSERVLRDYLRLFYVPAARQGRVMAADGYKAAREVGTWKARVMRRMARRAAETGAAPSTRSVQRRHLEVEVALNGLAPPTCASNAWCSARSARSSLCRCTAMRRTAARSTA